MTAKCTSKTGQHPKGGDLRCPVHGPRHSAPVGTAAPPPPQARPSAAASGLVWPDGVDLPRIDGVPADIAADLVERRVRRGFERNESIAALREIMGEHGTSPNLKDILIGERFASRLSGQRAVERIAAEQTPGRVASDRPQSVPISAIRKGDTFADGEFSTHERVRTVDDFGDFIAVNTDASLDAGAEAYRFRKTDTVWAITR